tara:strand:+ start:136 stop:804 length:669 start_codon:yes stop_codon:yes gene_type:complete
MRIESNLCHLSDNKVVVRVRGWIDSIAIGSALGQATTVEDAEDKAILRLKQRLNSIKQVANNSSSRQEIDLPKKVENAIENNKEPIQSCKEHPKDWSKELTEIDLQIKRLNWTREDELKFLDKQFSYNNRSKITKYTELIKYLDMLKKIDNINISKDPLDRESLIIDSNKILNELSWDIHKGREYLQKEFNVSTRKQLNNTQLITFVNKLKKIRNDFKSQGT